jgi:hypothetical protein
MGDHVDWCKVDLFVAYVTSLSVAGCYMCPALG